MEGASNYGAWKVKIRTILTKEDLQGLVFPQGNDQNAKEVVINTRDARGVIGDASNCYLALVLAIMTTTMVMKCRYKALATIIITLIKDELIPHIVDEEDPRAVWNIL